SAESQTLSSPGAPAWQGRCQGRSAAAAGASWSSTDAPCQVGALANSAWDRAAPPSGTLKRHAQAAPPALGVGSLQFNEAAPEGAQVQTHILGNLRQRFLIDHAGRQHTCILYPLSARLLPNEGFPAGSRRRASSVE